MLALVSSAGLIAAEGEDDTSAIFTEEIEQPGKVKRAVNFLTQNWMVTAPAAVLALFASITTLRHSRLGYSTQGWFNTAYHGLRHPFIAGKSDWKDCFYPGKAKVAKLKADADAVFVDVCKPQVDALATELAKTSGADVAGAKNALTAEFDKLTFNAAKELIVTDSADKTVVAENTAAGIAALKAKLPEFEAKSKKHAKAVADKADRDIALQAFNDLKGW